MSDYEDFIFSDDNEEIVEIIQRRDYIIRNRSDPFNIYDDRDFYKRFRLDKVTTQDLLELIQHRLTFLTERNHAVSPLLQLLIALRFYATGGMLTTVGDFGGVSKTTSCNIIKRVTAAIAELRPQFVRFPNNEEEYRTLKVGFYEIASFPRVIGIIDCTHIKIQSPGGMNAENFRNRKMYFSINTQVVCNYKLQIMDIISRWPGATHDAYIFNNSRLRARLETGEMGDGILLGDSGYPIRPYLLTPLQNPRIAAENLYNESQIRTRNCVERTFGVWKRRFPILSLGMRVKIETVQEIIVATAVLHNMAISKRLVQFEEDENNAVVVEEPDIELREEGNGNDYVRQQFINDYFRNL